MTSNKCPRCGYRRRQPQPEYRFGESSIGDLFHAAQEAGERAERVGGPGEKRLAAILDALWLSAVRGDDQFVARMATIAKPYVDARREPREWRPVVLGRLPNNEIINRLLMAVQPSTAPSAAKAGRHPGQFRRKTARLIANLVVESFPWLPDAHRVGRFVEIVDTIAAEFEACDGDADRLVQRSLVAAGMTAKEAHQRMAFRRMAKSRAAKKARAKARANGGCDA